MRTKQYFSLVTGRMKPLGAGHDHHHHEPAPVEGSWRDEADDRPLSPGDAAEPTNRGSAGDHHIHTKHPPGPPRHRQPA
jgi:hypothetical protein